MYHTVIIQQTSYNEKKYKDALMAIGAQSPALPNDKEDAALATIFNDITNYARMIVGAEGKDEYEKAAWCAAR